MAEAPNSPPPEGQPKAPENGTNFAPPAETRGGRWASKIRELLGREVRPKEVFQELGNGGEAFKLRDKREWKKATKRNAKRLWLGRKLKKADEDWAAAHPDQVKAKYNELTRGNDSRLSRRQKFQKIAEAIHSGRQEAGKNLHLEISDTQRSADYQKALSEKLQDEALTKGRPLTAKETAGIQKDVLIETVTANRQAAAEQATRQASEQAKTEQTRKDEDAKMREDPRFLELKKQILAYNNYDITKISSDTLQRIDMIAEDRYKADRAREQQEREAVALKSERYKDLILELSGDRTKPAEEIRAEALKRTLAEMDIAERNKQAADQEQKAAKEVETQQLMANSEFKQMYLKALGEELKALGDDKSPAALELARGSALAKAKAEQARARADLEAQVLDSPQYDQTLASLVEAKMAAGEPVDYNALEKIAFEKTYDALRRQKEQTAKTAEQSKGAKTPEAAKKRGPKEVLKELNIPTKDGAGKDLLDNLDAETGAAFVAAVDLVKEIVQKMKPADKPEALKEELAKVLAETNEKANQKGGDFNERRLMVKLSDVLGELLRILGGTIVGAVESTAGAAATAATGKS